MKPIEQKTVNAIRILAAEGVQKANSGHPGLPMGAAPLAYAVYGRELKHNPKDSSFTDRDIHSFRRTRLHAALFRAASVRL